MSSIFGILFTGLNFMIIKIIHIYFTRQYIYFRYLLKAKIYDYKLNNFFAVKPIIFFTSISEKTGLSIIPNIVLRYPSLPALGG